MSKVPPVKSIEKLPKPSSDLPSDQVFVRVGCITCDKAIHLQVSGVPEQNPEDINNRPALGKLGQIIEQEIFVPVSYVRGDEVIGCQNSCQSPQGCPQSEALSTIANKVDATYDTDL